MDTTYHSNIPIEALSLLDRDVRNFDFNHPINCHTCYLGFDQFECTDCDNWNIIPHSCHSRFCNACGVKYQKILAAKAQAMCVDVHNRHIVFTTTKNRMCLTECMNY